MCDCKERLQNKSNWEQKNGEQPTTAIVDVCMIPTKDSFKVVTSSRIELTYASKKKPKVESIIHNFCPWCGIKYNPEIDPKTVQYKTNG